MINSEMGTPKDEKNTIFIVTPQKTKCTQHLARLHDKVPARLVLYFLSWSGFLVSFMMRNDINFALVEMTSSDNNNASSKNTSDFVESSATGYGLDNGTTETNINNIKYSWSSEVQSLIISSFFCCYVLSQVVGGIATQYFGTKNVFGWSQFATALCSLCIPVGADLHYSAVIVLRSVQGFASGLTWPAMYAIVGHWIPLAERSRFMSSFQGFSIGIGLTYPLCGFLIVHFGWRYVFYTTGTLGIIWCVLWYFLATNKPQDHPRITPEELQFIEMNVDSEVQDAVRKNVPWKSILTSLPAWSIGITTFGRIWIHYVFIVNGPNFMKNILKFDYQANGFLSGMPFIFSYVSSVIFCYAADKIMFHDKMTLTNIRKTFTAMSQIIPGILLYWIGYIENITLLLVVWFVAVSFITASYAGAMANIVDIAPNYAGPVLAFCQTIHMSASFLSPLASGVLVKQNTSIEEWRVVFTVASFIACSTYVVYQIYGTSEIQKWNSGNRNQTDGMLSTEEERANLKAKKRSP